jgi:hypothetical protein
VHRRVGGPRYGLAAGIFLTLAGAVLALMVLIETGHCDELVGLVGAGVTRGMGEQTGAAPEAAAGLRAGALAVEATWYGSAKLESGRGWGLRGAAELRWRWLGAGASYTYRDGGDWVKHYPWARASVAAGPVRLVGEYALGGYNRERRLELRWTARSGRVVVEPRWFVTRHLQGTGVGVVVLVGLSTRRAV